MRCRCTHRMTRYLISLTGARRSCSACTTCARSRRKHALRTLQTHMRCSHPCFPIALTVLAYCLPLTRACSRWRRVLQSPVKCRGSRRRFTLPPPTLHRGPVETPPCLSRAALNFVLDRKRCRLSSSLCSMQKDGVHSRR